LTEGKSESRLNLLLASVLALFVFLFLYNFRFVDDNRLTGWQIVFGHIDVVTIAPMLLAAVMLAYVLSEHRSPRPVLLVAASFAVGTLFWREPEALVDAARYFTQAKHLELYGVGYFIREWGHSIVDWTDLPIVPFLYGLAYKVFGESRFVIQAVTTSMFSVTVFTTYLIGRDFWDEETGLTAGVLMMAMPFLYTQVPLMMVDVPSMFFLTLAIYAFQRVLREGGLGATALAALALTGAVLSKYSLWVMLSVFAAIYAMSLQRGGKGAWKAITGRGVVAVLLGLAVPAAFFLYKYDVIVRQMNLLFNYQRPGLHKWTESFESTFLFQVHPFVTAAAIYSVVAAMWKKDLKYLVVFWLVALIIAMGVRRSRYLIPIFPMLALMASYGLQELGEARLRRIIAYLAVTTSVVVSAFAFVPFLKTNAISNLMYAGNYLDTIDGGEVKVYASSQGNVLDASVSVPILDIYTHKKIDYEYERGQTPGDDVIKTSPLRFTWGYVNPEYYRSVGALPPIVAVITPEPHDFKDKNLGDYRLIKTYDTNAGLYRYRPFVSVYAK